jgi:pimeloyl-ACP methyl ester carboxylesterase
VPDGAALASLGLGDYLRHLLEVANRLGTPPVLIGHSMGGLLAQMLAARIACRALVCVASAPPWMLTAQMRALPHLAPLMPRILAGRPITPSPGTLRALVLHDLPSDEQEALIGTFGTESGRAYRSMVVGLARVPRGRFGGPVLLVSGDHDRIISSSISARIANLYGAEHQRLARGHWLIAPSARDEVAGPVLRWLDNVLAAN